MKTAIIVALAYFNGISLLAQDCDDKLFFLEAIKTQFLYQDTIITNIDTQQIIALDNGLFKSLHVLKCYRTNVLQDYFFSANTRHLKTWPQLHNAPPTDSEINDRVTELWRDNQENYFCYSFFRSSDDWYTLTFLAEGKYVPRLIIVNYNPQGQFNIGRTLFSRFIDAGEYFVTSSSLKGNTLIVSEVKKWETGHTTVTDSIASSFVVLKSGQFVHVNERRLKFEK
jgi:hypothetical protein